MLASLCSTATLVSDAFSGLCQLCHRSSSGEFFFLLSLAVAELIGIVPVYVCVLATDLLDNC